MSISLPLSRQASLLPGGALPRLRPRAALARLGRLAGQLALLWLVLMAGSLLAKTFKLPLPGNLAGMLLLLGLLWGGVIRLEWIADLANMLVQHLMLFFIPLAVGLIVSQNLLAASGLIIAGSLIGSAVIGIAASGVAAQLLIKRGEKTRAA